MSRVVIGVDPPKASNTLVVIDRDEQVLAQQRFPNGRAGYRGMKKLSRSWDDHVWAVEGAGGTVGSTRLHSCLVRWRRIGRLHHMTGVGHYDESCKA